MTKPKTRKRPPFVIWISSFIRHSGFVIRHCQHLRFTGLYGVRPSVEFVQIATLVENIRA